MKNRTKAAALNQRGLKEQDRGHLDEAVKLFEQAAAADPRWSVPAYNLGLIYKRQKNWKKSLEWNRRATTQDAQNQAAWWNMGIAATALGRWNLARSAWRGYGIEVADGEGPVDLPCGVGPVRINPSGDAEVVWGYRRDPARMEIASIPLPESKHRWHDVVLNDGAPNGYRKFQGKEYPVFDALELLQPSPFGTFLAQVVMPDGSPPFAELVQAAEHLEGSAEDWSTSLRMLCKACSEGRPHKQHDTKAAPADGVHLIGIAGRDQPHATKILEAWQALAPQIRVESVEESLPPGHPPNNLGRG